MCVNACGTQDSILKHGFLLTPCVQKLAGRYTEWIPCGFFALTFFFTVFSFLLSTFGTTLLLFFSNESRKIVHSLLIVSTVAMLNCSPGILLKSIQDLNFHSL